MTGIDQATQQLLTARTNHQHLPGLAQELSDAEQGYAIQYALVETLLAQENTEVVGYKIGCTNPWAQQLLHTDGPFYGQLLANRVYASPAELVADDFFMRVIEPEFAFVMAGDLPPLGVPYEVDQVAAAVEAVLPAIEVVDSRYQDWTTVGGPSLIADNGCTGAWLHGEPYNDWRALDLAGLPVVLYANDEHWQTGNGSAVLGHPLQALTWLANTLCDQNRWLKAGDYISTGTCCEVYMAQAGDRLRADFGLLGQLELDFR